MTSYGFFDLVFAFARLETDELRIDNIIASAVSGCMNIGVGVIIEALLALLI
jgi:hypothetical protein